ncbi:MAG: hypothetical protein V3S05_04645, partial [Desulfobacterales bacterium]
LEKSLVIAGKQRNGRSYGVEKTVKKPPNHGDLELNSLPSAGGEPTRVPTQQLQAICSNQMA